jgi:signal transduction histidine kinase
LDPDPGGLTIAADPVPHASGVPPHGPPTDVAGVCALLAVDIATVNGELDEIAMLSTQAATETERHESRRAKAEERVAAIERDPRTDPGELRDARAQLLMLSRRATLFEAQQQVLEGKGRTLARFRDKLVALEGLLAGLGPGSTLPDLTGPGRDVVAAGRDLPGSVTIGARVTTGGPGASAEPDHGALLRAQEELRRDIARHMHDGPAQSLANIALQAEIVQRLATRGDPRTMGELGSLRAMVQAALETTKEFIFDVRPMVLDDLGLVPTLRRVVIDRGRRAGVDVSFDSQGPLRRIDPNLESGLFRIVAEAATGYLALRPNHLQVRMDWADHELSVTIQGAWASDLASRPGLPRPEAGIGDDVPPALRAMIEQNLSVDNQARTAARMLPDELMASVTQRAHLLGVGLRVRDDGATLEINARLD